MTQPIHQTNPSGRRSTMRMTALLLMTANLLRFIGSVLYDSYVNQQSPVAGYSRPQRSSRWRRIYEPAAMVCSAELPPMSVARTPRYAALYETLTAEPVTVSI